MSPVDTVRLMVRCKHCGTLFDTGRVVNRQVLEDREIKGTKHVCRHCATSKQYRVTDYIARNIA